MSYKSDARGARPVSLIAVHTAEGARTAASLGAYFYQPSVMASSHVGIDAGATLQYVGYDRSAWTLRSGNPISDNAELCGFAHWTRAQWLGTGAVEGCANPRAMLDRTAAWVRSRCLTRGIPIRKLSASDVAAGRSGVIAHWDWTVGMHDGTHTDPGSAFPWDYVISKANEGGSPGGGGGGGSTPGTSQGEDFIMNRVDCKATPSNGFAELDLPGGDRAAITIYPGAQPVWLGGVFWWGEGHVVGNSQTGGLGNNPSPGPDALRVDGIKTFSCPGALLAQVEFSSNSDFHIVAKG